MISRIRKYEDIYHRSWMFEIGKLEFIIDVKKRKFKPFKSLNRRRRLHLKF